MAQTLKAAGILVFRSVDVYPRIWTMIYEQERHLCVERTCCVPDYVLGWSGAGWKWDTTP